MGRTNRLLSFDTTWLIENDASNNYSIAVCTRCRGNVFTEPFPSSDKGDTHIRTDAQTDGRDL
jgi:hypothetical protein